MANKTKIFVVYHKLYNVIVSDVYQPILVGENKENVPSTFLRDDVGDNIADKNDQYNELTAIYWVYKNIQNFKEEDNIGFCHYRRFFCFDGLDCSAYVRKVIDNNLVQVDNDKLNRYFRDFDFIVPRPNKYRSVESHYKKAHNKEDMPLLLECIKKVKPEYLKSAESYLKSDREYSYNMFIFKKSDFIKYCEFVFPTIEEFLKNKTNNDRLYISERLTGIFVTFLKNSQEKPLILPVLHVRSKSLKAANKQVKENFKKKSDRGLFYKIKPLFLCLLPRSVEQILRRKKAR